MSNPRATVAAVCFTLAALILAGWVGTRRKTRARARLFTLDERRVLGEAYGANCVWRPCHWLPAVTAIAWLIQTGHGRHPALLLVALAGTGMPITRRVHRCAGLIEGGHQLAHSRGGTTSIWNGEPCCRSHNGDQLATHSWRYAWGQFGPLTLIPYAVRVTTASIRLLGAQRRLRRW